MSHKGILTHTITIQSSNKILPRHKSHADSERDSLRPLQSNRNVNCKLNNDLVSIKGYYTPLDRGTIVAMLINWPRVKPIHLNGILDRTIILMINDLVGK